MTSNLAERHAPLDWLAVRSLDNAVQLQHVRTRRNLEMRRDIFGGADDAEAFRGAPEREAVPLGKLDDVWNVTTIRSQTREALEGQNDLFNTERVIIVVKLDARQPQHARVRRIQVQLRPFLYGRSDRCSA